MPARGERGQRQDCLNVDVLIEYQPNLAVGPDPISLRIALHEPGRRCAETKHNVLRERRAARRPGPGWDRDPILRGHRHPLAVRHKDERPRVHPTPLAERLWVQSHRWVRNYSGVNTVQGDHRGGERNRHAARKVNLALWLIAHHLQRGRRACRCPSRALRVVTRARGWWKRDVANTTGPRARE